MRIEGTYTFPGPIEGVFAALLNPDLLQRALPGCERIGQLGPAAADGAASFELRLRPEPAGGVYTVRTTGIVARRPAHLRVELRGRGPETPLIGTGRIDLVAQETHTVGAYVFDVQTRTGDQGAERSGEQSTAPLSALDQRTREAQTAAQRFARLACERLGEAIRPALDAETSAPSASAAADGAARALAEHAETAPRVVRTARGRIVALPATPSLSPLSANADAWMERLGWLATGMVLGMAALGLLVAASRLLGQREE